MEERPISPQTNVKCEASNVDSKTLKVANSSSRESLTSFDSQASASSASSASSIPTEEPFKVKYSVTVTTIQPTSENSLFQIESKDLNSGETKKVQREYQDFEQLNYNLISSSYPAFGLIIPPLPKFSTTFSLHEPAKVKQKLGSYSSSLTIYEWDRNCFQLQQFLTYMLNHPIFGRDEAWLQFLRTPEPAPRIKLKKSNFLSKLSENMELKGKTSHKDCEEYFQKERDWNNTYSIVIKQAAESFNNIITARLKLVGALSHLSTALNLNFDENESSISRSGMKLNNHFSIAIDDYRRGLEMINYSDEASMGTCLETWSKFVDSEREMLLRRTGLLIDYEKSNRVLDKAKSHKKDIAEKSKLEMEKLFEDCSDIARQEIKRFHKERSMAIGASIEDYSKAQLLINKDILQLLLISLENLKHFQL